MSSKTVPNSTNKSTKGCFWRFWRFCLEALTLDMNHRIDQVPSELILASIFRPYYCLTQFLGIAPLRINSVSGKSTCKFLSWSTLYALFTFGVFIVDSCLFIPMFIQLVGNRVSGDEGKSETVTRVAQVMFLWCQYLGAALSYILIPFTTSKMSRFWNKFQRTTSTIANLTSTRTFVQAFMTGRWTIRIWFLISVSFSVFCVYR
jgi:hypothetical protein